MSYFQARLAEVQIPPKKPQKYLFHVPRTKKQDIAKAMSCFCFKLKRDSNPYNLLQDEVLSKEVYNRKVCVANSRANEVSRVACSPPKIHRNFIKITVDFSCLSVCIMVL